MPVTGGRLWQGPAFKVCRWRSRPWAGSSTQVSGHRSAVLRRRCRGKSVFLLSGCLARWLASNEGGRVWWTEASSVQETYWSNVDDGKSFLLRPRHGCQERETLPKLFLWRKGFDQHSLRYTECCKKKKIEMLRYLFWRKAEERCGRLGWGDRCQVTAVFAWCGQ